MRRDIKESDWKLLRELHPIALDRFCERVLREIERVNADRAESPHQRYLDIYRIVERRDREIAECFNDLRHATAIAHIAAYQSRGLLAKEELLRFSPETRAIVETLLGTCGA